MASNDCAARTCFASLAEALDPGSRPHLLCLDFKVSIIATFTKGTPAEPNFYPTSIVFSPNLGFLNRGLGPTVRETVLVTGHLVICRICFEIKWGWVKRACAGEFSAAHTGNGGSHPGCVRLRAHCFFFVFALVLFCGTNKEQDLGVD